MAESSAHESKDRQRELDAALDEGELAQLPPNQPKGLLGEKGLNLYKVDDFEPDLNAGVSQDNDAPVVWLAVIVAYLLFFPLAFWILWRTPLFSRRAKVLTTVAGCLGLVAVSIWLFAS